MSESLDLQRKVAELQAAHRELEASRVRLASLLQAVADQAPAVMYAKDRAGRFLFSNALHAALLGRSPVEIVGRVESDLVDPEAAAEIDAVHADVLASGETRSSEFTIQLGGEARVFLEYIFPLTDEAASTVGVGGVATEITQRRRAEEAAAIYRELAEHSPDGCLVRSLPGAPEPRFAYVNPALRELLGAPDGDDDDELVPRLHALDPPPATLAALVSQELRAWHDERELLRADGSSFPAALSSFIVPGAAGAPGVLATQVRDLTQSRRAAAERERQAEIIAAQQAEIIAAQERALAELAVPLIPIAERVLLLPLVGVLRRERLAQVGETLLLAIVERRVRTAILDLTGVHLADEGAAGALLQLTRAVRTLGAQLMCTGIGPALSVALEPVGLELAREVPLFGTLQRAVKAALASTRT